MHYDWLQTLAVDWWKDFIGCIAPMKYSLNVCSAGSLQLFMSCGVIPLAAVLSQLVWRYRHVPGASYNSSHPVLCTVVGNPAQLISICNLLLVTFHVLSFLTATGELRHKTCQCEAAMPACCCFVYIGVWRMQSRIPLVVFSAFCTQHCASLLAS